MPSSHNTYKQAKNVERRTWDRETYEARAKARLQAEQTDGAAPFGSGGPLAGQKRSLGHNTTSENGKDALEEEFTPAAPGAAGPVKSERAFLKARRGRVDIDSKIGSTEMVSVEAAATSSSADAATATGSITDGVTKTGVGWHCKVCDCFLKDSHTYLDHINGRKHQRNLGYSMRTEKSTQSQVQDRLKLLVKQKQSKKGRQISMDSTGQDESERDYKDVIKGRDKATEDKKAERARRRKEQKKLKKKLLQQQQQQQQQQQGLQGFGAPPVDPSGGDNDDGKNEKDTKTSTPVLDTNGGDDGDGGGIDPALAAMMGFGGFGGGNKNR